MNDLENTYQQALDKIKQGHSKEEVLLLYPKYEKELSPLLDISLALYSLPKKQAPEPAMQRKYALAVKPSLWFALTHLSKLASVSVAVMLLASAASVAAYKASSSSPGQALFAVKKSAEQLQIILASDENAKARIQLEITQKRLSEAQIILNDPESDPKSEAAAIKELASQTTTAVEAVDNAAKNDPKSEKNTLLLTSLDDITKRQQSLLTEVSENDLAKGEAEDAIESLSQTNAKVTEIKNFVATAQNEQEPEALPSEEVKGVSTDTTTSTSTSASASGTQTSIKASPAQETPKPADPNIATGSFILEDPTPQFFGQ